MSAPAYEEIEADQYDDVLLDEISKEMERYVQIDRQIKELDKERKDISRWVTDRVKRKAVWQKGDEAFSVTVVRPATAELDLDALRESDRRVYDLVTTTKVLIDRDALAQLIDLGMFAPGTEAAKTLSYKSSSPSLRFKQRALSEGSDD